MKTTGIRLILFEGVFETLDFFVKELVSACEKREICIYLVDMRNKDSYSSENLKSFILSGKCVALSFNHIGYDICCEETGENIWEKYSIPFYSWLVDHPKSFPKICDEPISTMHMILVDKDHMRFAKKWCPGINSFMFLPHGGSELENEAIVPFSDREIDVIYVGNCQKEVSMPDIPFFNGSESFYTNLIQLLLNEPWLTVEDAIDQLVANIRDQLSEDQIWFLYFVAGRSAICLVRREMKLKYISALDSAGVSVDIFGDKDGWMSDRYPFSSRVKFHGRVTSEECLECIRKSKVVLNIMPWFKSGSHERLFNSQLNHALCITERNAFVDEHFVSGEDLLVFDPGDYAGMVKLIKSALSDPERVECITEKGFEKADKYDRWENRLDAFLSLIGF